MARLANQVVQVLVTYATRPRTWGEIWVPLGCIAFTLQVHPGDSQAFSLFAGFFAGTMFAGLVREHTLHQFAHPRSALLPGFALPHLLAVVPFAMCASLLTPAFVTMIEGHFLFMAAIASATFAFFSAWHKFIRSEVMREMFPMLVGVPMLSLYLFGGIYLWDRDIALTPASSIMVIVASWTYMALNFARLVRLREDAAAYAPQRRAAERRLAAGRWCLHELVSDPKSYTRKGFLSDMWNDRIGGFHRGDRLRIVQLLRHGATAWPPGILALLFITIAVLYSAVTIYGEQTGELTDELGDLKLPRGSFRLVPVLFGMILPAPLAVGLALNRQGLAAKLLLPLSRKQLIENSILAGAWNFAVHWIPFQALLVYLIWTAPGPDTSMSRITTFVFLSTTTSLAALCFGLSLPSWKSPLVAFLFGALSAYLPAALLLTWWLSRDALSDAPFWIVGTFLLSLGLWFIRQAPRAWLNMELGVHRTPA